MTLDEDVAATLERDPLGADLPDGVGPTGLVWSRNRHPNSRYGLESICGAIHNSIVEWTVVLADEFEPEFDVLPAEVQDELLAQARVFARFGPTTRRPVVDTLKGSKHANMKELRFEAADGVWRVAFAFDPQRQAILLCAGDKSGQPQARFYRRLTATADRRFDAHLTRQRSRGG